VARPSNRDFGKPRGEADRETENGTKAAKEKTSNYRSKNGSKKQLSNGPTGGTRPRRIACAAAAIEQEPETDKHSHRNRQLTVTPTMTASATNGKYFIPKTTAARRRHQPRCRLSDAGPKLAQLREHS
jgi:hypothetical protein